MNREEKASDGTASLIIRFSKFEVHGDVVEYTIIVTDAATKESWSITARYSALSDLHKELKSQAKGELPEFPPKKWFGNTDPSFISQRQKALENYFNVLLSQPSLARLQPLQHFLHKNKKPARTTVSPNGTRVEKPSEDPATRKEAPGGANQQEKGRGIGDAGKPVTSERTDTAEKEKIVSMFSARMIDLSMEIEPPEKEDSQKRRDLYKKHIATGDISSIRSRYKLPRAVKFEEDSLLKETLPTRSPKIGEDLGKFVENLKEKLYGLDFVADEERRRFVHFLN